MNREEIINTAPDWRRSSACDTNACVEVAMSSHAVGMRGSDGASGEIWFTREGWAAFIDSVKRGLFDVQ